VKLFRPVTPRGVKLFALTAAVPSLKKSFPLSQSPECPRVPRGKPVAEGMQGVTVLPAGNAVKNKRNSNRSAAFIETGNGNYLFDKAFS